MGDARPQRPLRDAIAKRIGRFLGVSDLTASVDGVEREVAALRSQEPPSSTDLTDAEWAKPHLAGALTIDERDLPWFVATQAEWRARISGDAFPGAGTLSDRHVANARLMASRNDLLDHVPKKAICAEVGTAEGAFATLIHERCEPAELHLFDLDFGDMREHHPSLVQPGVVLHEGDSADELSKCPPALFDWIYIDADNSYAGAKRDIDAATRALKPDGVLAFNDYIAWSPLEFLPYGVPRAVNELCVERDWEIMFFCLQPWMYCDIAVRKIRP